MKINRRNVLKKTAGSFGLTFIPSYLATGVRAEGDPQPPSKRINLGCVGVGGRAGGVIPGLCNKGNAQPVAFADVDYSARNVEKNLKRWPSVKRYSDFREMMDKSGKDIDAVSIVVPDHSHFCATILAMSMGKHVYVEKPLTHSFQEAELLMKAEKKFKVVTQMGNQGHTGTASNQFREWVKKGVIKNVTHVDAWKGPSCFFMQKDKRITEWPKRETQPKGMNWDLWLGPAEYHPFSRMYHTFEWRGFHPYGSGMLGDWGCHIIDMIHHYLDLGLPTEIKAQRMDDHNKVIFPLNSHMQFKFPARGKHPELTLNWKDGVNCQAEVPKKYWDNPEKPPRLGGAGTLFKVEGADYMIQRNSHGGSSRLFPYAKSKDLDLKTENVREDHLESFVQACLGNGKTWSPFSVGGLLTQVLTLGCIAQYFNQDLEFDPKTHQITNDKSANERLSIPPRKGWEDFYKIV